MSGITMSHPRKDGTYILFIENPSGSNIVAARRIRGEYYDLGVHKDTALKDVMPSFEESKIVAHHKTTIMTPGVQSMIKQEQEARHGAANKNTYTA